MYEELSDVTSARQMRNVIEEAPAQACEVMSITQLEKELKRNSSDTDEVQVIWLM